MDLNVSITVKITDGVAEFAFPDALKREPLKSTIRCDSIYFKKNRQADNECLFLVCSGSYYYTQGRELKHNILAMFQNKKSNHRVSFSETRLPITLPQEHLKLQITDHHGKRQAISCDVVIHIVGQVANKLLAI